MSISTLKDIEHERVHKMMENNFQVSRYCRLQEVVDLCKSVWGKMIVNSPGAYHMYPPILAEGKPVKMWRLSDETEKTILMNTLQMGCKSNPTFGYKLFLGSAELMDTKKEIREFDLIDKSYLIAEMK